MILNSANSAYEHCQVYLRLYIKRSIWYEHIPAGNEENNRPGSWTSRTQRLSTAEALAWHHYKGLTCQEEQKCTHTQARCNVRVINTVIIVLLIIFVNCGLPRNFFYSLYD